MPTRPTTTAAYVSRIAASRQPDFTALRDLVKQALPKARETMSYKMPTYEIGEARVCAIAAQARHFSLYLCESPALERHRGEFEHLDLGKGCIRFRSFDDLPKATTRKLLREAARDARADS